MTPVVDEPIGGHYVVDFSRSLPEAGGGLPAYATTDTRGGRAEAIAIEVAAGLPPRGRALGLLLGSVVEGLMVPLAHGPARSLAGPAWFIICQAPPGPSLSAPGRMAPFSEAELIDRVLRPAVAVLEELRRRQLTHRAIRPDNIFRLGPGDPVVLGAAWAAPPASGQSPVFEPPSVAMCHPSGRGEGEIADDVYALGVTLVALALGRVPLAGMEPAEIIRLKLERGSFQALVGEERLPHAIAEVARGMLAEDPDHRPPPAMLADAALRGRRVAARPPRRALRPIEVGRVEASDVRVLAFALANEPDQAPPLLRGGAVDRWLRRTLGDAAMAGRVEEAVRQRAGEGSDDGRADAMMVTRAIALLDPLAPLCWRGVVFWPDGLGPLLAAADPPTVERLEGMILGEVATSWGNIRPDRCDLTTLRATGRQNRATARKRGGLARLRYMLNPLLACRSRFVENRLVVRLADLLPALEAAAAELATRPPPAGGAERGPVDDEIAAFIAARHDQRIEGALAALADPGPDRAVLGQLRLLADLQSRLAPSPVPALSAWLARLVTPTLAGWRNRARREAMQKALSERAESGVLAELLGLIDDPAAADADAAGCERAESVLGHIDAALARIDGGAKGRAETARRVGQEITAAIGATALAVTLVAALVG